MNGIGSSFEVQTHLSVHAFSIDVRSWWTTRMGQPLESERRYVAVSAKGCRKLWEDVELARWAMASVASTRSQVKSLVLPWRRRSTVSWRCHPAGGPQSLPSGMVVEEPCFLVPSQQGFGHAEKLKRCSTFSREEGMGDLLPFPLSPEPTKAEMVKGPDDFEQTDEVSHIFPPIGLSSSAVRSRDGAMPCSSTHRRPSVSRRRGPLHGGVGELLPRPAAPDLVVDGLALRSSDFCPAGWVLC